MENISKAERYREMKSRERKKREKLTQHSNGLQLVAKIKNEFHEFAKIIERDNYCTSRAPYYNCERTYYFARITRSFRKGETKGKVVTRKEMKDK